MNRPQIFEGKLLLPVESDNIQILDSGWKFYRIALEIKFNAKILIISGTCQYLLFKLSKTSYREMKYDFGIK